ncbi:hypothetical protein M3661_20460 [Paenibacillus sp. MER 180]|uniref:hypothetical protein n=1 Tax=Paenibacillus sp. MER 180 TaxID=2939570 RepID=UPI00203E9FBC|nr:hypothetical protein [Paenibacillus sp. MER 180]MCM3292495.1 hypothetical protein [Paenibacillus sp. MER 180]
MNLYTYVANNPLIYSDPTGHEYGRVSDFVSDFGGTIVHGKETIGYNVTFKFANGISKNETVYSNTMPHYLVSKDTQVIYKSIFRKYADISITGNTQRFYYDENKIVNGNMYAERAEFYEKMGASFKAVRYSFEKSESEAKVENFLSGFYVNTVLGITTGGVKAGLWVATTLAATEHSGITEFTPKTESGTFNREVFWLYNKKGGVRSMFMIDIAPSGKIEHKHYFK